MHNASLRSDFTTDFHRQESMIARCIIKAFESVQTKGLPMTVIGGTLAPFSRLTKKNWAEYQNKRLPWALKTGKEAGNVYNVYWEQRLEDDIHEIRKELNINLLK